MSGLSTGAGASAPRLLVVLEFERKPRIVVDAPHEGDYDRLIDWILAHADYDDLLQRAHNLGRAA